MTHHDEYDDCVDDKKPTHKYTWECECCGHKNLPSKPECSECYFPNPKRTHAEETDNGVVFNYLLVSPKGGLFTLYPYRDVHDVDDVRVAKQWVRARRDVVAWRVKWVDEAPARGLL